MGQRGTQHGQPEAPFPLNLLNGINGVWIALMAFKPTNLSLEAELLIPSVERIRISTPPDDASDPCDPGMF